MSRRVWGWVIAIVCIAAVAGVLVVVWHHGEQSAEAQKKAVELKARAAALGIHTPSVKILESIYGTDGGAVAATANSDLARAISIGGIGRQGEVNGRPLIIDRQVLVWHYLVLSVYQPEKVAEFKKYLKSLATENVVVD
jgi:hypothetical protein